MRRAADEEAVENQRQRYMELAGMLKEKGSGHIKTYSRIVSKFALQEGIKQANAKRCGKLLEDAGLISFTKGRKMWRYNPDAEWELFNVQI